MQEVSGEITENTLWAADTILVTGDIFVAAGIQLQIGSGVRVEFADYYSLQVSGSIMAEGTAAERIIFTSANSEYFSIDASHRSAWNGIRFPFTSALQDSSVFRYCVFEYAKATLDTAQAGAVISVNNFSRLKVENSIFRNNVADRGGAIACRTMSQPEVINNLFYENYCLLTGVVFYNEYSYPLLLNNTMTANYSLNEDVWMPACPLTNLFSKPRLYNNIIWANETAYFLDGEIFEPRPYYYGINAIEQELNPENIFLDPELTADFSLSYSSPCLDAGMDEYSFILPETDLAGNDRYAGSHIDLGCYEYQTIDNDIANLNEMKLNIYPNPFNPAAAISYFLEDETDVRLEIYNLRGQHVRSKEIKRQAIGKHEIVWLGEDDRGEKVAAGVYVFCLKTRFMSSTIKGILLK
ncbi:MAG: T9SS type A sorting domain-containing protein [Candidatus Cloacimonetes bacterium]|nr:T9SS type A sorting domain-containing protein [Candidatus Cloacimonadota bacterium]